MPIPCTPLQATHSLLPEHHYWKLNSFTKLFTQRWYAIGLLVILATAGYLCLTPSGGLGHQLHLISRAVSRTHTRHKEYPSTQLIRLRPGDSIIIDDKVQPSATQQPSVHAADGPQQQEDQELAACYGSDRDTCESLQHCQLVSSTAQHCFTLQTQNTISLQLCTKHGNRTGHLFIHNLDAACTNHNDVSNTTTTPPNSVYGLRIVGPEIQQPAFRYCGCLAAARFSIQAAAAGDYHLQVLQYYTNFSTVTPQLLMHNLSAATFKLEVQPAQQESTAATAAAGAASTQTAPCSAQGEGSSTSPTTCPTCTGFNHPGRWVVLAANTSTNTTAANTTAALLQALLHTCVRQPQPAVEFMGCPLSLKPAALPSVEDAELLEWLPYSCRYHKLTGDQQAACHAALSTRGKVCFVGDSQMRHLYNQVVHLVEGPAAGFRASITGEKKQKEVINTTLMVYVQDRYGNVSANFTSSNCSHVFANFGQWPLSYLVPRPWNISRYSSRVAEIARRFKAEQALYGNKLYWVTTSPHPITQFHQEKLPNTYFGIDWRTEPFVMAYNAAAVSVMRSHGIPVVDTFSITAPLVDLSYDGAHFLGTVGLAQARMVVNILCGSQSVVSQTRA